MGKQAQKVYKQINDYIGVVENNRVDKTKTIAISVLQYKILLADINKGKKQSDKIDTLPLYGGRELVPTTGE